MVATVAGSAPPPSPSTRSSAIDTDASRRVGTIRGRDRDSGRERVLTDVGDNGSDMEAGVWRGRSQRPRNRGGRRSVIAGEGNGDEEETGLEMREAWPATTTEDETGSFVGGGGSSRVFPMSPLSGGRAKSPPPLPPSPPPSLPPEPRSRRRVGSPATREEEARLSSRIKLGEEYFAGGRWMEFAGSPQGGQPPIVGGTTQEYIGGDDDDDDDDAEGDVGDGRGSPTALLSRLSRSDGASLVVSPGAVEDDGDGSGEGGEEEEKGLMIEEAPSVQRRDRGPSPSSR